MKVLSLFDGMSCGRIALDRANIKVTEYYASEVDKYAIKVSKANYPDIIQIGDVTKVSYKDGTLFTENGEFNVGKIDLLIGGSPCQSFSNLGDGTGFEGKSGLFFEWFRIYKEVQPVNFLLENVKMKKVWKLKLDEYLGVKGVEVNSNLVSAQNRSRFYWSNLQITLPIDKEIYLSDIIDNPVDAKYLLSEKAKIYITNKERLRKKLTVINGDKSVCLPARYTALNGTFLCVDSNGKLDNEKSGTLTARYNKGVASFGGDPFILDANNLNNLDDFIIRKFTPIECERLQTVPENYTSSVADTHRYKMLGNGWTVDVIASILAELVI